ncbi:MAG: hypothetical protein VB054_07945 [Petrimonas sp.]|jgi:hypothetical protein|nr:hypothetical protein [Petrimonas sp.]
MNTNFLPGIKKVGYCKSANLQPDIVDFIDPQKTLKVYGKFIDVPIVESGTVSVKNDIVKGVNIYTVKSKFIICGDDDYAKSVCNLLSKNDNVFRLTTVNNKNLLVGTHQKPNPVVSETYLNEDQPAGKRGYEVEITYTNIHSYIVLE